MVQSEDWKTQITFSCQAINVIQRKWKVCASGTAFNNTGFLTHASRGTRKNINKRKHRQAAGKDPETLNAISLQIMWQYWERKHYKCIYWYPVSNNSHIRVTQGCIISHHPFLTLPLLGHSFFFFLSKVKHRKEVFLFRDARPALMAVPSQKTRGQRELRWGDTKVARHRINTLCIWTRIN